MCNVYEENARHSDRSGRTRLKKKQALRQIIVKGGVAASRHIQNIVNQNTNYSLPYFPRLYLQYICNNILQKYCRFLLRNVPLDRAQGVNSYHSSPFLQREEDIIKYPKALVSPTGSLMQWAAALGATRIRGISTLCYQWVKFVVEDGGIHNMQWQIICLLHACKDSNSATFSLATHSAAALLPYSVRY